METKHYKNWEEGCSSKKRAKEKRKEIKKRNGINKNLHSLQ
jgi:hypothetical protein